MDRKTAKDVTVTAARGALAAIPVIGGLLVEVFFEHRSRVKQRRLEEFLSGLGESVNRLKATEDFARRLQDERFGDLLESAATRAVRTGEASKHERLRRVLLNELQAPAEVDINELYLDLIAELSDKQIEILGAFRKAHYEADSRQGEARRVPLQGPFRTHEFYNLSQDAHRILVLHLVSRGLLFDDGVGRWNTSAHTVFEISALGRDFLRFIEAPAAPAEQQATT